MKAWKAMPTHVTHVILPNGNRWDIISLCKTSELSVMSNVETHSTGDRYLSVSSDLLHDLLKLSQKSHHSCLPPCHYMALHQLTERSDWGVAQCALVQIEGRSWDTTKSSAQFWQSQEMSVSLFCSHTKQSTFSRMPRNPIRSHKKQCLLTGWITENNSNRYSVPTTTILKSIPISGQLTHHWMSMLMTVCCTLSLCYMFSVLRQNNQSSLRCAA